MRQQPDDIAGQRHDCGEDEEYRKDVHEEAQMRATAAIWEAVTAIRVAIMSGTMSAVVAEASRADGRNRGEARRVRIDSPMGSAIMRTKACAKGCQLIPPP